jgi:hypothetical protein
MSKYKQQDIAIANFPVEPNSRMVVVGRIRLKFESLKGIV